MGAAVVPVPEGPKVKFAPDSAHPKAPARGLRNIPVDVLRSLVQKQARGGPSVRLSNSLQKNIEVSC